MTKPVGRYFAMSLDEIALACGLTVDQVRTAYTNGVHKLQERFAQACVDMDEENLPDLIEFLMRQPQKQDFE